MHPLLEKLSAHQHLTTAEAETFFSAIVEGQADPIMMAGILVALRSKGETVDELTGAAKALLRAAQPFPKPEYDTIDCCGTGGDGLGTLNVSTAVAFVLAAAGVPVVKHGNRSVSSQSGSSDVLKALGISTDITPEQARETLDKHRLCFLHAPHYHPGVKHAMPVRQALKIRTLFNLLGPIINPAQPAVRLMGVYDARLLTRVAETLRSLGVKRAWVVNGGIDELALHQVTTVAELKNDEVREQVIDATQVKLPMRDLHELKGGDPVFNANEITEVLAGRGNLAFADAIALNAGAGLVLMKKEKSLVSGVATAHAILRDGAALHVLQALQRETPYVV